MKPITTLVFKPTDEMPFWKLCTIGASDYLMPECDIGWGRKANRRNEYMMLIAPEVEVNEDSTEWLFLNSLLWSTAEYAFNEQDNLTVSDTVDMGLDGKYCGTVLLLPEVFKSPSIVKCYVSEHKYISIFQVMPITRELLSKKLKRGRTAFIGLWSSFTRTMTITNLYRPNRLQRCNNGRCKMRFNLLKRETEHIGKITTTKKRVVVISLVVVLLILSATMLACCTKSTMIPNI